MAQILILSAARDDGRSIAKLLGRDGHRTSVATSDASAITTLCSERTDLIVLSVPDPEAAISRLARTPRAGLRRTPALAIVSEAGAPADPGDGNSLVDRLPTPFSEEVLLARIDAWLRVRRVLFGATVRASAPEGDDAALPQRRQGWLRRLMSGTDRALHVPVRRVRRPIEQYLEAAASIASSIDRRDTFDPGHAQRVANHSAAIAAHLGLDTETTQALVYAASVHDIGKVTLSAELLGKPELTEADRRLMRLHPKRGAELLRALTPYAQAAELVQHHHERPDGLGYYGLNGEAIPLAARILSVAEAFDGMTTCRKPTAPEEAVERLRDGGGTAFDETCVDALAKVVRPRRTTIPLSSAIELAPQKR